MSVVTQTQARKGRIPELLLLTLALAIGFIAYYLVHIGTGGTGLPSNMTAMTVLAVVIAIGAHLMIRHVAPYADPVLFPCALALNGVGLAMIYRIDVASESNDVRNQLILSAVGMVFMVGTVVVLRDHRLLRRFTWTSLILGVVLLLLPLAPGIGIGFQGARIWIRVAGFSFQPAEVAKICFAVFFASYLVSERDNLSLAGPKVLGLHLPKARHMVPLLLAWLLSMGTLAAEKDFGTAILFFGLFVAMLYAATERVSWIIIGALLTAGGVAALVEAMPHIQARFTIWLHALDADVYDAQYGSYQLVQGLFGMASGGLFGTGLGEGYPTKSYAANSDFIMASLGEEIGLVGMLALLSIYLLLVMRGLRTAIFLRDGFGKLLATGLSFTIAIQCFIVVGGVTRVIPLTGLAMPFLAHGGSALLANWIIIGLLLRISDAARRPAAADPLPPQEILEQIPEYEQDADSSESPEDEPSDSQETQVVNIR
ncbi:FtsW/RodA/SpoVE family cell cycle protein [Actinobaculum sp. 352]|uniref:FtsW/RodA/SpoVE family cell cycle protein n=1 Tax=Actinobaculum sp. 352 TaxID=2490946 RepID=UPI000F7F812E|nr:FtsW/RodA/SpoVE family cell cycle protein [Actinobaculum sp. 352]RTE49745.1 FtsW/RodA/SpoVE family cell cycle protein [Actinobaculum sp. 352]